MTFLYPESQRLQLVQFIVSEVLAERFT